MPPSAVTLRLAERVAAFRHQGLPPELVAHAKLYLLDTLGAMLVASAPKYPGSRIIMRFVKELGGVAESSLVGQGGQTSCVNAALANGTLGYYCDVEPHHVGAILHGLAVMVPTSLAVGEKQGADGQRFFAAIILGVEVATRVSYAFDPVALYNRGFHPSAICGAFGAAAADRADEQRCGGTKRGCYRKSRVNVILRRGPGRSSLAAVPSNLRALTLRRMEVGLWQLSDGGRGCRWSRAARRRWWRASACDQGGRREAARSRTLASSTSSS